MKLTDFVVDFLAKQGIRHVFGVTGGAALHLFDSCDRCSQITPIFTHHEQTAAFAAQSYARIQNALGAGFFTTGPGGTNAITGVAAAWLDSIPCVYISGQTRSNHTTTGKKIRQLGAQQLNIVDLVKPITKYAIEIDDPEKIKYHLEKAVYLAKEGRPGPVWIDLPLNFQWAQIEPNKLKSFDPVKDRVFQNKLLIKEAVQLCIKELSVAKRPIVLAGYGVRLAGAQEELITFIEKLQVPVLSTWNAKDLIPSAHALSLGCLGMSGQRGANLAVQNCDFLLCLGSHLSIPLTGTRFEAFAREAKIMMVDVDKEELLYQTVKVDFPVCCDAKEFLREINKKSRSSIAKNLSDWRKKCSLYKTQYNVISRNERASAPTVNPYVFIETLSDEAREDDVVVVDGGGTITQITFQAFKVKKGQRLMIDAGLCAMGSGLPQSIGACFARNKKRTICLCGDGSFQFNVQDLQTIAHHHLPIKIFIINNNGYLAIRHTQDQFFNRHFVGTEERGGVSFPDILKVGRAYGIKGIRIRRNKGMGKIITDVLAAKGPVLCEIMVPRDHEVAPRQGFDHISGATYVARPLEDMYPFLDRKEFSNNMIVKEYKSGS